MMKKRYWLMAGLTAAFCWFGEAAAEPVPLSLAESIRLALAWNDSIDVAKSGREAAKWNLSAARRAKGPTVSWSSQLSKIGGRNYESAKRAHEIYGDPHTETVLVGNLWDYPVTAEQTVGSYAYNNTFANSWSLTIPIYTGGQLEGQIDARRYELNQADLNLENTRQTVRYQAAEAYSNLLHQENVVLIAQEAVDMAQNELNLILEQYGEGAVAKADVLMMQVRLANHRQNLVDAQGQLAVAKSNLANVVGLPQDADIRVTDVFSYEPYPRELPDCEEYAMEHRPDGIAADYAIKSAEAQVGAAKSGWRPRVTGSATQSISSNSPFRSERSNQWEAGLGITWNIFDSGVTSAGVHQAKAMVDQYRAEAERTKKNIQLETRSAYIQMRAAEEKIRGAKEAVQNAEESYMIAQVRYEEGVDILLNVADAQERLTQARQNYNAALYQYNLYRVALEKAMGVPVGFDPELYAEAEGQGASPEKSLEASELLPEPMEEK